MFVLECFLIGDFLVGDPPSVIFSLRSWRYCEIKVLAAEPRSQKRSGDEAFEIFLAASPLVTATPSNLTRLYYNGSAAKCHSTTTQYRELAGYLYFSAFIRKRLVFSLQIKDA